MADYDDIHYNVYQDYCISDGPPRDGRPWVARKKNNVNNNDNNSSSSNNNGDNWQTGAQFPHVFRIIDIVNAIDIDNVDVENNA